MIALLFLPLLSLTMLCNTGVDGCSKPPSSPWFSPRYSERMVGQKLDMHCTQASWVFVATLLLNLANVTSSLDDPFFSPVHRLVNATVDIPFQNVS